MKNMEVKEVTETLMIEGRKAERLDILQVMNECLTSITKKEITIK